MKEENDTRSTRTGYVKWLWLFLVVLASANSLLIAQNLRMRNALAKLEPRSLKAGDKVEPFSTQDMNGNSFEINYTGHEVKRVLMYFSPDCGYCKEQFVYWQRMMNQANRNRFQLLGLVSNAEDRSKVSEYLKSMGCESLRIGFISDQVRNKYKLLVTPSTFLVASDGTVEKAWTGVWDADKVAEARAIFEISFTADSGDAK